MNADDLKIGETYINEEKIIVKLKCIISHPFSSLYKFSNDSGYIRYYLTEEIPSCIFSINEPKLDESTLCTHNFKLYVGLTESFKYCILCDKKE